MSAFDMLYISKREEYESIKSQLKNERSSFDSHWQEIGDHVLPRRLRFVVTDVNKGNRRNQKIIDSTATFSSRTLASGMMSGVTSPARPWFRLTHPDQEISEKAAVKKWLYDVGQRLSTMFLRSNLYNVLPIVYSDMGSFGTGAVFVEEDFTGKVMRFTVLPVGSYMISNNESGEVDTLVREFQMTVRQIVKKFGYDPVRKKIDWTNISENVKSMWDNNTKEAWVEVTHIIKPNDDFDDRKLESKFKKYISCYYETGSSNASKGTAGNVDGPMLSEKGYDYFPALVPRWETTGEDAYGTNCPGMIALGDIKQLQLGEKRVMQGIEKMVNPPMVGPSSLKTTKTSILPGDITYSDERDGTKGFRPAHEVNIRVDHLMDKQREVQRRIQRAYFEDLFLMLAQSDRREITAREIDERHEEKLLALGPVLEQLNQDLLDPLISIAFEIGMRQGLFPEPPPELDGVELKVEYISIMAQAMKLVGIAGLERFVGFATSVMAISPGSAAKVNTDELLDVYSEAVSIAPKIVRTDEEVDGIRQAAAQAQQQQARAEQINMASQSVKNLSQSPVEGDSALNKLMQAANAGALTQGVQ